MDYKEVVSIRVKTQRERETVAAYGNKFWLRPITKGHLLIPFSKQGIPLITQFIIVDTDQLIRKEDQQYVPLRQAG